MWTETGIAGAAALCMVLGACSLKTAAVRKADQWAGGAVVGAVEKRDPELAAEIREEAASQEAAGSETPWLKALGKYWWGIALALGIGGEAARRIRKLLLEKKYLQAVAEILSSGVEKFKGSARDVRANGGEMKAPEGALIRALDEARAAHPDAPAGSLRRAMEQLGARAARTSPA